MFVGFSGRPEYLLRAYSVVQTCESDAAPWRCGRLFQDDVGLQIVPDDFESEISAMMRSKLLPEMDFMAGGPFSPFGIGCGRQVPPNSYDSSGIVA